MASITIQAVKKNFGISSVVVRGLVETPRSDAPAPKDIDVLWLGRVAPKEVAWRSSMGERGRRLDPCSIGFRFRPRQWRWTAVASFVLWIWDDEGEMWRKTNRFSISVDISAEERARLIEKGFFNQS